MDARTRSGMTDNRAARLIPAISLALLAAIGAHACQVPLKREAFVHLEAVSPEILWECDLAAIERLSRSFTRTQLQTFALHADRRRKDASPFCSAHPHAIL